MALDLEHLEPTKISRDLKGKFCLIYGEPKTGKTSLAVQFPKSLLLAFEKGYNGLAGIHKVDVPNWRVMREAFRELKKPKIQALYDTVIIDTTSIAWDACTAYICTQFNVGELGDVGFGKGYKACKKEFANMWNEISQLGYGIVFLAHAEEKIPLGGKEGEGVLAPQLEKRPYTIVNGMVDIIACIDVDRQTGDRFLQLRSTPRIFAGSRFGSMPDRIPLGYEEFVNALADAIEKEGEKHKGLITDEREVMETETRPFEDCMTEAGTLWNTIQDKDPSDTTFGKMLEIVKKNFGQNVQLSTVPESQQDLLELTVLDLQDLLNSL